MLIPVSLTSKWQMTIPKPVRKMFGITRPGKVLVEADDKEKSIKVRQVSSIFELAGTFKPKKNSGKNVLKAREYLERHYERT